MQVSVSCGQDCISREMVIIFFPVLEGRYVAFGVGWVCKLRSGFQGAKGGEREKSARWMGRERARG